jgi:hypothetical protein
MKENAYISGLKRTYPTYEFHCEASFWSEELIFTVRDSKGLGIERFAMDHKFCVAEQQHTVLNSMTVAIENAIDNIWDREFAPNKWESLGKLVS